MGIAQGPVDLTHGDGPAFTEHGGAPMATESKPARTAAEIEADIERTRQRLQVTVDAIAERVSPVQAARRRVEAAKAQVIDPETGLRTARVAALSAGVLAVVGLIVWRRRR
jgi:Protein of unknown function (DUF3618)